GCARSSSRSLAGNPVSVHHSCPEKSGVGLPEKSGVARNPGEIRCREKSGVEKSGVGSSFLPEKTNRHRITPDTGLRPRHRITPDTGLRPRVLGQPVIVSHNWASMNLERWATLSVATVTVSLGPTDNRAWAARCNPRPTHQGPPLATRHS